ncbi:sporozoite invasion-associated protein 1 [Sesbania bispinosa]|nr:sporozoite invasion-associated protein 1 [Sesbania bispinosa]
MANRRWLSFAEETARGRGASTSGGDHLSSDQQRRVDTDDDSSRLRSMLTSVTMVLKETKFRVRWFQTTVQPEFRPPHRCLRSAIPYITAPLSLLQRSSETPLSLLQPCCAAISGASSVAAEIDQQRTSISLIST